MHIYLAHRKGKRNKDLLGADLIYENEMNKAIVFIQYKLLNDKNKWLLDYYEPQLLELLQVCQDQGQCHNLISEDSYRSSSEMRLYDCPVFYKLISHDVEIDESKRTTEGVYIQACRARQLFFEHSRGKNQSLNKNLIKEYGFPLDIFATLLRRGHIGSNSNMFYPLRRKSIENLKGHNIELVSFAREGKIRT